MLIRDDFKPVGALLQGMPAEEALLGMPYAHIDSAIAGVTTMKENSLVTPRLMCFKKHMTGHDVREASRNGGEGYRPATWAEHIAFSVLNPDAQHAKDPHPIVSVGSPVIISDFRRAISVNWNLWHGRSLYTYFDCARFGPLVWFLVVKPQGA